jgi:hypothetical protein
MAWSWRWPGTWPPAMPSTGDPSSFLRDRMTVRLSLAGFSSIVM